MEITDKELNEILVAAAKEGVKEYRKQVQKEKDKNKYHNTYKLMKSFRDAVFHCENAVSEGEQVDDNADEKQATYLRSVRRTKFKTLLMINHIDKMVKEVERRYKEKNREVEYEAFDMYFMQGMNYQDIAEELNTGSNTPRRWIRNILNELSVLLWGLEDDEE